MYNLHIYLITSTYSIRTDEIIFGDCITSISVNAAIPVITRLSLDRRIGLSLEDGGIEKYGG